MSKKKKKKKNGRLPNNQGSVSLRSDGRWQAVLTVGRRDDGTPVRKYKYAATKTDAFTKVREMIQLHGRGELSADAPVTFGDLAHRWLRRRKATVKATTYWSYRRLLEIHVLPRLASRKIETIRPTGIEDVQTALLEHGLSPRSVTYAVWLIRAILEQAVKDGKINRNPAANVERLPKIGPRTATALTAAQAWRFLKAAENERLYAAFFLMLALGLRRGEVLGLRWADVNLEEGWILVCVSLMPKRGGGWEFSTPKTANSRRRIFLAPDVVEVLQTHREKQEWERIRAGELWQECGIVITTELGTPYHPDNLKRVLRRISLAANVPVVRIHDLRHTHASLALMNHIDDKVLSERLGHADVKFTRQIYQHTYEEQHRAAALRMDVLLGSARQADN